MKVIEKGSPVWGAVFQGHDTDSFFSEGSRPDRITVSGDLSALLDPARPKVLVTGSRDIGAYEKHVVGLILKSLADNPAKPVVISGLAIGTDTAVHEYALSLGMATVAVLPCWIDEIYPYHNTGLARRIADTPGCALVSQFPEGTAPEALRFIERNRTIAMMSDTAVLAFSKSKGSSIITARLMYDLGKRVLAVPGRPTDRNSEGCNDLIRQGVADILAVSGETFPELKTLSAARRK